MSPELAAGLGSLALIVLGLLGALLKAWGEKLFAELKANTKETKAAKAAAEKVADQVDYRQQATALRLELDEAKRRIALVQSLTECHGCRMKIESMLAVKPVDRRQPPQVS